MLVKLDCDDSPAGLVGYGPPYRRDSALSVAWGDGKPMCDGGDTHPVGYPLGDLSILLAER